MALTQPFISSIPAFNATSGTTIYVNVLGGDTINKVTVKVDNLTNGSSKTLSLNVTDSGGDDIRTFSITLDQSTWSQSGLANDCTYQVRAYTTKATITEGVTTTVNSISSSMVWFTCYAVPTVSLYYRPISGSTTTWTQLTSSTILTTDAIEIQARVSSGSATFASGKISVYKYYDALLHEWETANITSFNDNIATIERLNATATGEYYWISFAGETADGMAISTFVSPITVAYVGTTTITSISAQNVCASGNVSISAVLTNESSIAKVIIRRKISTASDVTYINVATITPSSGSLPTAFSFADNFCASNQTYTYMIITYNTSGQALQSMTTTVYSEFNSVYIGDGSSMYTFVHNWNISNAQRVQKSATYEAYGTKYPTIAYNPKTNYIKQTTKAILLTDNTLSNSTIDRYGQTELLEQFNDFLTNNKAKFFKDFNGNCWLINVVDTVSNDFMQEVGNSLATVQFSWVEAGGFTQSDLNAMGFADGFNVAITVEPKFFITSDNNNFLTSDNEYLVVLN